MSLQSLTVSQGGHCQPVCCGKQGFSCVVGYVSGESKIEATAQRLVLLIVRVCVCVRACVRACAHRIIL